MAFPESFIYELKARNDISEVISNYISLKRRGRNRVGLCPFHGEKTPSFNVYDDIRAKLIRMGIPEEQIRFIHEADSDAQKKELFGKVRSGEVRILLGSTQKMGAGTNVQDRLIAMHNLDCPWRPSDLERAPVKAA